MRTIVAYVCLDENGKYSLDVPQQNQGGDFGIGTVEVGDGELAPSIRYLESNLNYSGPHMLVVIKARAAASERHGNG